MIICDWGYANYRRLTSGKCWDALIASIDSIKWIIFSSNYIDFLLISKWSENGQRSRLQTIFSAKGPIYRRSVSIITSIISSFRLSFMLNSVLYHTNWPSKSTCIAIRLIQKQKCIIQEKLYSTVNWGIQCTTMVILYCTKELVLKALALGYGYSRMLCSLWLHGENGVNYQNDYFQKLLYHITLTFWLQRTGS